MTWNVTLEILDRQRGHSERLVFQTIALDDEHHVLQLGSSPLADVTLADDIAPQCGMLIVNDVGFSWLRPQDGAMTFEGAPVTDTTRFPAGSVVEIGHHAIALLEVVPAEETWKLAFVVRGRGAHGDRDLRVFHQDQVIVGRVSSRADLVLPNGNVSKRHCMFYMHRDELNLKDLGSTNGMWVNGARPTTTRFGLSDKLYVGDWVIELAEPPRRVPKQR